MLISSLKSYSDRTVFWSLLCVYIYSVCERCRLRNEEAVENFFSGLQNQLCEIL